MRSKDVECHLFVGHSSELEYQHDYADATGGSEKDYIYATVWITAIWCDHKQNLLLSASPGERRCNGR